MDDCFNEITEILKDQVTPALGCTEPGAVAYAVAIAKEIIGEEVKHLNILVDKNIFKNGLNVGIPGTDKVGLFYASALSLAVGKSSYKLEVLKDVNGKKDIEKAKVLLDQNLIDINVAKDKNELYIKVIATGKTGDSEVIIEKSHLNVTKVLKNGEVISSNKNMSCQNKIDAKEKIKKYNLGKLYEFADRCDINNLAFIENGINMNLEIANEGLENKDNNIADALNNGTEQAENKAKTLTVAACQARMSGSKLPVMSSAGSGNHGLVAILPIAVIGNERNRGRECIIRAVTLSHLVTIYVKAFTGSLSPVCGCGVAAGVGCAADLVYLLGGRKKEVDMAINNVTASVSGMICDGAKIGCANKLAVSVSAAIDAARMALAGVTIPGNNGILDSKPEGSIQNLGKLSKKMAEIDDVILSIMTNKKCMEAG